MINMTGVFLATNLAAEIVKKGGIEVRVKISGIFQRVFLKPVKRKYGSFEYTTLYTDKLVSISDLEKIANEILLPIESPNGRVFPKGKSALDFTNIG